jgi:hypothetical protein
MWYGPYGHVTWTIGRVVVNAALNVFGNAEWEFDKYFTCFLLPGVLVLTQNLDGKS